MKKKSLKVVTLLLSGIMLLSLTLTGCGKDEDDGDWVDASLYDHNCITAYIYADTSGFIGYDSIDKLYYYLRTYNYNYSDKPLPNWYSVLVVPAKQLKDYKKGDTVDFRILRMKKLPETDGASTLDRYYYYCDIILCK